MTFEEKKAVMKAIIEAQFERKKMRYKFTIWAWKDGNERKTHIGFTDDTEIAYELVRGFDHCELVDNVSGERLEPIIVSSHYDVEETENEVTVTNPPRATDDDDDLPF